LYTAAHLAVEVVQPPDPAFAPALATSQAIGIGVISASSL
jgi:hypothetical protein